MDNGWIKLHRKFTEWEWYHKSEMVHLFLHLLLMANHEDGKWQGQQILRGQIITGRLSLSKNTHISQQTIRTCLHQLQQTGEISVKSTNKYSIITLIKYNDYQKDDRKLTNNQPTTNQQLTTNNNNKKNNNNIDIYMGEEKSIKNESKFIEPTLEEVTNYCLERKNNIQPQKFIDFYKSKGWFVGKNKMKDWKACIRTWEGNSFEKKTDDLKVATGKYNNIKIIKDDSKKI